jgi:hypothetical protein
MTKSGSILKPVEKKIAIATKAKFDPKEYYQTRNGLYVWGNFGERILSKTSPIKTAKKISIVSYELTKSASDESIEKALPKKHIFDESEVCAIISTMIDKQAKGEEGDLLNTGYANIFYTKAFVVRVDWHSDGRHWYVSAWRRGGGGWAAGGRVFSPAKFSPREHEI